MSHHANSTWEINVINVHPNVHPIALMYQVLLDVGNRIVIPHGELKFDNTDS